MPSTATCSIVAPQASPSPAWGGPTEATAALISSGKLADFFSKDAPLTSMVPISYTVNSVREQRLASMARTTEYTATTYNAQKTNFKYRITAYWKILDSDDGFADNTVECYGELRLNTAVRWSIPRIQADLNKREAGQTIDILDSTTQKAIELDSDSLNPTSYDLVATLTDADSGSDDDPLGDVKFRLNLEQLAGKGEFVIPGRPEAEFHIRVERIG